MAPAHTDIVTIRRLAFLVLVLAPSTSPSAEPSGLAKDWQYDTIQLKNGSSFKGLILEETETGIRFQNETLRECQVGSFNLNLLTVEAEALY